jgi:GNAT superfamily N-acetyltransferase
MHLIFEKVMPHEDAKIKKVYEIIKNSGQDMFHNQGLSHWKTPYPIESIRRDCLDREVFLIKDMDKDEYVNTFQLEFINYDSSRILSNNNNKKDVVAYINKFATIPQMAGKGVGKRSIDYIETYCKSKGISKLCLDVYEKSEHAIRFYKNRGFSIIGQKPTKHFVVYLMEKQL